MVNKATRNKMEKLIYDTFDAYDPSGINTDRYKGIFKKMTDKEFTKFLFEFFTKLLFLSLFMFLIALYKVKFLYPSLLLKYEL